MHVSLLVNVVNSHLTFRDRRFARKDDRQVVLFDIFNVSFTPFQRFVKIVSPPVSTPYRHFRVISER